MGASLFMPPVPHTFDFYVEIFTLKFLLRNVANMDVKKVLNIKVYLRKKVLIRQY